MNKNEDRIIVIQCAARKQPNAGHIMDGERKVMFVADPAAAPPASDVIYRRPDHPASSGRSFRDALEEYNRNRRADNPLRLLPAWKLYYPDAYRILAEAFGVDNLYILSAGWGLVAADYLLPNYDITFSSSAKGSHAYKRRRKSDRGYRDFAAIQRGTSKHVVFLGGKDYVPLFCRLTRGVARRTVVFNSDTPPDAPGCDSLRYESRTRTNWHYKCARLIVSGHFSV